MLAALRLAAWVLTQAWRWGAARVARVAAWIQNNWRWVAARIGEGWTAFEIVDYIIRYIVG